MTRWSLVAECRRKHTNTLQDLAVEGDVNERRAAQRVLYERAESNRAGHKAANVMLSIIGGGDIGSHLPRCRAAMTRAEVAGDFDLYEQAHGFQEALLEHRAEQGQ